MKKILFIFLFGIFFASLISASSIQICIDHIPPSAPSNLILTNSVGLNIQLKWTAATDEPSCSGISNYEIYRGFNGGNLTLITNFTTMTNYLDSVPSYGKYSYIVHAVDLVGHNDGNGILDSITLSAGGNSGGTGGGGGGGGFTSVFECGNWTKCIQSSNSSLRGTQTRICQDVRGVQANKTELKSCIPNFVPNSNRNLNGTQSTNQINLTNSSTNKTIPASTNTGFLTGAAIGAGNLLKSKTLPFIFIILVLLLGIFIILRKRKSKKKRLKKKK